MMNNTYPYIPDEFKDKRVLVTGGTKGAGEAIVRRFALAGACVATAARSPLPEVVLLGGILMAGPLAFAVYLAETSQFRARAVTAVDEQLKKEIAERERPIFGCFDMENTTAIVGMEPVNTGLV